MRESFSKDIEIGIVQYVDYEKEWVPEHEHLLPFLYKRKSFHHEQEIRALKNVGDINTFNGKRLNGEPPDNGISVMVDLEKLIECIYVSPKAPTWFYKLVKKTVNKYKLNKPVKQSSLMADPFY